MTEIWKDVKDFTGMYEVSNLGNIRSVTRQVLCRNNCVKMVNGKILRQQINRRGYSIIGLSLGDNPKTFSVHQLVATAFIPNFCQSTELNHIDGNKQNNAATNLEISNGSHNQLHAVRTGLKTKMGKSRFNNVTYVKNPKACKRWAASIRHDGKSSYGWKTFHTEEEAAHYVDTLLDNINDTSRNRNFP
jgi:hypothetical protein